MAGRITNACITTAVTMGTIETIANNAKKSTDNHQKTPHVTAERQTANVQPRHFYMPTMTTHCDPQHTAPKDTNQTKSVLTTIIDVADNIPQPLQKPASALLPALGATTLLYPVNFALTLKQKNETPIVDAVRQMTNNGKNPRQAFTGLSPVLKMAALQRTAQYTILENTKSEFKERTDLSGTLINLFSSWGASLADTLIMGPAEVKSIGAQIAKTTHTKLDTVLKGLSKSRGYQAIAIRDLVANSFGFTLPQVLREEWNMDHDLPNRLATTFFSQALANTILTPIDSIKTALLTQPNVSAKDTIINLWDSNRLWNGYGLRTLRQATMFTLVFVGAEQVHKTLFPPKEA